MKKKHRKKSSVNSKNLKSCLILRIIQSERRLEKEKKLLIFIDIEDYLERKEIDI